jgi:hypothetical protein
MTASRAKGFIRNHQFKQDRLTAIPDNQAVAILIAAIMQSA